MPRGGRRPGAGRKKKQPNQAVVLAHPSVPAGMSNQSGLVVPTTNLPSPIQEFDAPNDLTADERAVWMKQAPHAFRARTLTQGTSLSFERYCKLVVMERAEAQSSGRGGPNHRGLIKQIGTLERDFCLAPIGRPLVDAPVIAAQDDDEAFFGGSGVQHA